MLKKFAFAASSLFAVYMMACSSDNVAGGGSIDPNTIATKSSSSGDIRTLPTSSAKNAESSSGVPVIDNGFNLIVSSSSSEMFDGGIARTSDFSIQCVDDVIYVDLDAPAVAADVAPPEAFKHVDDDAVEFVLLGVYFDIPCDEDQRDEYIEFLNTDDSFPIGHKGDTLYVTPLQSKGIDYACSCAAKATFTLDKNYSGINYTVFGQKETLLVQEK